MDYEKKRTYRKFRQEQIPETVITEIMHNLRYAPSARNAQVLRYTIIENTEMKELVFNHIHFAAALPREIAVPKEDEKPMAYIVISKPDDNNPTAFVDMGIAAEIITAAAWEHGVGSCILMNINKTVLTRELNIPEGRTAAMVIAMGYPSHDSTVVNAKDQKQLSYTVDEDNNYYVPKLSEEELFTRM